MREQLLAAKNLVMGTTNILLIALPDAWRVMDGPSAPEVDRWTERQNRRWMSQGQVAYRLVEPHAAAPDLVRAEVELRIRAVAGEVDAHAIRHSYTTVRRGFLPHREVSALQLEIDCPETGRRLWLELSPAVRRGGATAGQEDLARLLAALESGVRCH